MVLTSPEVASALSSGSKVLLKISLNYYNRYKREYEEHQQTIKTFDNLIGKSLQYILTDKYANENLCRIFITFVDGKKTEFPL